MKNFFYRFIYTPFSQSLRKRLLIFFLILAFIPAMLTGLLSFRISSSIVYNMATDSSIEMIDRISQSLNNLFSDTIYFMYHVQEFTSLQQGLRTDFENIEKRYLTDFNVSSELQFISDYKREIFGIYVLGENNSKFKSNYYTFKEDNLIHTEWYNTVLNSNTLVSFGPYSGSLTVKTEERWGLEFFSFGIPFIDRFTGNRDGVILAEFEKERINRIITSSLGKTGFIILLDNDNNIILAPENYNEKVDFTVLPKTVIENFKDMIISQRFLESDDKLVPKISKDNQHIIIYQNIDIPGWKVIGVIPFRELRIDKNNTLWYIILIAISSCLIAGFASFRLSSTIVRPIIKLTELMRDVEDGNLQVRMETVGNDEIGQLSYSFNIMAKKLRESMDQIYLKQSQIRKTELQLLQAQINPHFLYNTLDAIKYLAKRNENPSVVKMVVALARFFRSSLSKGLAVIPLQEEVDRIENYLTILKMRYKNKFTYEIDIPKPLLNNKVLKLSLQPLVENAIYHGIKETPCSGIVRISASKKENNVIIEVEDSGKGISLEKIAELEKSIHNHTDSNRSYGLRNVQERIEIFFGEKYGLAFFKREGGGTIVRMTLPEELEVDF